MTNKDVLLLTSPAATACLRGITNFAHVHGWFITIEDREHPPRDWRGDGVLATIGPNRTALVAFVRRVRRRGDCTRGSPQTGDALDFACRARFGEGNG